VPANPAPGVYAISASNLQGVLLDDPSTFDWFRRRSPDAIVGGSILVYNVAADPDLPQAVGLCRKPWTPVEERAVNALFDRQVLRVVRFDCDDAWWWPDGPAWYVVPSDFEASLMGNIEYERRRLDDSPVFRVLRHRGSPLGPDSRLDAPARFAGGLTLLGFNWPDEWKPGQRIEVESVWRVDEPLRPPVSIFAHVLDTHGAFVAGADGMGMPAELLRSGDVIVQRHRFDVPATAAEGEFQVEFGFYRLDTLERYPVIADGGPTEDRILATPHR
jgi:hypothetical protein